MNYCPKCGYRGVEELQKIAEEAHGELWNNHKYIEYEGVKGVFLTDEVYGTLLCNLYILRNDLKDVKQ